MRYGKKSTSPFFLLSLLLLFFSLNPCISKTLRGTGLNFCTQVGFNDSMCSESLRVLHKMDDSQLETTPLRSFFGLPKFSYLMRTCPPTHISQATRDFDVAMRESLESILGAPLCEWSWLKALLPSSRGGINLQSAFLYAPAAFLASSSRSQIMVGKIIGCNFALPPYVSSTLSALSSAASRPD